MKKILLILLTIILLSGCTESENSNTYTPHKQTTYLGVITDKYGDMVIPLNTDVFIITTNDKTKDEMIKDFNNTVVNYHKLFDSHHDYENINNIKTINDNYGKEAVKVDKEIIEILKSAIKISNETDGYFTQPWVPSRMSGKICLMKHISTLTQIPWKSNQPWPVCCLMMN